MASSDERGAAGLPPGPGGSLPPPNRPCHAVTDLLSSIPSDGEFRSYYEEVRRSNRRGFFNRRRFKSTPPADFGFFVSDLPTPLITSHLSLLSSPPLLPTPSPSARASTASASSRRRTSRRGRPCFSSGCRSPRRRAQRARRRRSSARAACGSWAAPRGSWRTLCCLPRRQEGAGEAVSPRSRRGRSGRGRRRPAGS